MARFIARSTYCVFAFISAWIFLAKCSVGNCALTLLIAVFALSAIALLTVPLSVLFKKIKDKVCKLGKVRMGLIIFAAAFIPRILSALVLNCDFSTHEDMGAPQSFLHQLINGGMITENASYAAMYGRYTNTALVLYPWALIFGSSHLSVSAFFCFGFSLSYVAWFNIIGQFKSKDVAFVSILGFSLLWQEIWLSLMPIHESVTFFFLTAFAFMIFWVLPKLQTTPSKLFTVLASGLLLGVAVSCNSMGYVALIAFALYASATLFKDKLTAKKIIYCALCLLIISGAVFGTVSAFKAAGDAVIEDGNDDGRRENTVPYGWSLYVGGNFESNGRWRQEDYDAYFPSEDRVSDDELYEHQKSLINQRYGRYKENPLDYIALLTNKVKETYGNYNYGIRRTLDFAEDGAIAGAARKILPVIKGVFHVIALIMQGLLIFSFSRKKWDEVTPSLWLKAFFCGVFMILLVIESMPKYVTYTWALMMFITVLDGDVLLHRAARIRK